MAGLIGALGGLLKSVGGSLIGNLVNSAPAMISSFGEKMMDSAE